MVSPYNDSNGSFVTPYSINNVQGESDLFLPKERNV